ncbi:hypothetical protein L7D48_15440 [Streptomyces sp. S1A]|uniref:hypothetical protein n=1 Tax=Streptomyces sp. ICN903 TaxID=2964654 RepID=UPI001EDC6E2A|nr:hypothetical protein [Streptomyces sp. ICN903]MCG3041938.1 hypothetical protein [Streptomyces sp. ICN903]
MTPIALAIACLLAVTLGYAALCAASPFGRCRKCNGLGFQLRHTRRGAPRRGKHCRRCKGHGIRIRAGRWIFNRAAALYRDGTR